MSEARGLRLGRIAGWSLVGLGAVGAAVGLVLLLTGDGPQRPSYRFATERHVNREGGYSFWYPPDWDVTDQGTVSEVSSPGGDTTVSFGQGAPGGLGEAQTAFVQQIQGTYRRVRVFGVESEKLGPYPAVSVAGAGTNAEGVRIRFLAITAQAGDGNYSIAVFTAAAVDPADVLPPTEETVNSFRRIPEG